MRSQNGACKVRSTHPHAKQKKKALEYVKAKEKIRHMALCEFMVPKCCAISHQASESSLTTFEAGQHLSEAKQIAVSWPWSQVQGSERSSPSPVTASIYRSTTDDESGVPKQHPTMTIRRRQYLVVTEIPLVAAKS
nr:hypothetical protein Iba_chr05fCG6650 [Ipomoea batatas]